MNNLKFTSNSELDTMNFAKSLASKLQLKDVIVLTGDIGSGKTKFTEGILTYFGLENEISSPTFTSVNEYLKKEYEIYTGRGGNSDGSELYNLVHEKYSKHLEQ